MLLLGVLYTPLEFLFLSLNFLVSGMFKNKGSCSDVFISAISKIVIRSTNVPVTVTDR